MSQPTWRLLDVLGDVNPIDHGGMLVYEDTTGAYAPEAVVIKPIGDEDGDDADRWIVYRFPLERCTYVNGVLSDNEFHPECPAWFADSLESVASFTGVEPDDLIKALCSDHIIERAAAYQAIGESQGFINFDGDPITDFDRSEMEARYAV